MLVCFQPRHVQMPFKSYPSIPINIIMIVPNAAIVKIMQPLQLPITSIMIPVRQKQLCYYMVYVYNLVVIPRLYSVTPKLPRHADAIHSRSKPDLLTR